MPEDKAANEKIISEIRAVMGRQDISTAELARRVNWPYYRMRRRLKGTTPLSATDVATIAEALEVPVSHFGIGVPG